jgi:hypothetical protein
MKSKKSQFSFADEVRKEVCDDYGLDRGFYPHLPSPEDVFDAIERNEISLIAAMRRERMSMMWHAAHDVDTFEQHQEAFLRKSKEWVTEISEEAGIIVAFTGADNNEKKAQYQHILSDVMRHIFSDDEDDKLTEHSYQHLMAKGIEDALDSYNRDSPKARQARLTLILGGKNGDGDKPKNG